ncbi:MAG: PQQ-dependent sugar dehydrogenase [Bacteroidota bacterium]|nr:PQQ-dependent sugar dehydrogenase [Bacteroidota bacterium]
MKPSAPGATSEQRKLNMSANLKAVDIQLVASDFASPIGVVPVPDATGRLAVIDQVGKIWMIDKMGKKAAVPFLDITNKIVRLSPFYDERGLLGLAFHPDYATNRKFYIFYTAPPPPGGPTSDAGNTGLPKIWNNTTTISEFSVTSNPDMADPGSERKLFQEPHPQANHNGGTIAFGPDGYLYISIGDGGNKNDIGPGHVEDWYAFNAGGNGQDIEQNLLGNILRIDVNSTSAERAYGIPPDNPFVGRTGRDEIYAFGFRNPFRFSFDNSGSRRLFAMDAGQSRYEEINVVEKGGNYGWNVKEGTACFNAANEFLGVPSCPHVDAWGNRLIDPVIQLKNWRNPEGGGRATTIVAGEVYRGNDIPGFQGKYIFGTFSQTPTTPNGELFIANPSGPELWGYQEIELASHPGDVGYYLRGFGKDLRGEIYLSVSSLLGPTGTTGKVFKLVLADKK